jgi:hypothetical protein
MKDFPWVLRVLAVFAFFVGVAGIVVLISKSEGKDRSATEQVWFARDIPLIKKEMLFFKHRETGMCFAYWWGGGGNGGPALTHVPCSSALPLN